MLSQIDVYTGDMHKSKHALALHQKNLWSGKWGMGDRVEGVGIG